MGLVWEIFWIFESFFGSWKIGYRSMSGEATLTVKCMDSFRVQKDVL